MQNENESTRDIPQADKEYLRMGKTKNEAEARDKINVTAEHIAKHHVEGFKDEWGWDEALEGLIGIKDFCTGELLIKDLTGAGEQVHFRHLLFAAQTDQTDFVKELLPHTDFTNFEHISPSAWSGVKPDMKVFIESYEEGQQLRANLPSVADEMRSQGLTQTRGRRL